jgi:hypothetical protein
MDLIPRTSYVSEFKEIKDFYDSHEPYNGWDMDCADLFRHDEWMLTDDTDYAENTYQDLLKSSDDEGFEVFLRDVISSMKYNLSQIKD